MTSKMCEQCRMPLCDTCFNKTHKNFVIFKNHYLKNIAPVGVPNVCGAHNGKHLDYYCKDCEKAICMDCMMVGGTNSCKTHNTVSIQEVNEQIFEELSNISPKIDETFRRLTKTAVDVGQLLYKIENDTETSCTQTQMIADVEQHFSKLDCQLQKHKQELIDLLIKYKLSEKNSLLQARSHVADAIKKSKTVTNAITASGDPKIHKEINLTALLQTAKEVIDTPWYLTKDEVKGEPLKLLVKEELCKTITDYIRLEGKWDSCYKLQSSKELGEDIPAAPSAPVMPPELPKDVRQSSKSKQTSQSKPEAPYVAFYKNVPHYRAKSDSITSLNSISSESSYKSSIATTGDARRNQNRPVIQPVSPFPESQHPTPLLEGSQELIYISHIVEPHNFYVQRVCHQSAVKEIIRAFRNAASMLKPSVNHVAREKVYLVDNKADNMWQRCRVVDIDRKDVNKPVFKVFCFDFGSTEKVTVDELRLIPPARLHHPPPLAIHCSLSNCTPKAGGWTCDDSYLIRNIIDNKQAVIYVRQLCIVGQSLKVDCDVTTFEDGISIAHALVFHERARFVNPRLPYPEIPGIAERPTIFMNNNDLKYKSVEEVYIINVMSPDKFFVRKQHLQEVFEKLCDDLDQEYSLSDTSGSIYLPEVGMFCVVNLDRYSEAAGQAGWARCLVTETPGRGRVRVLLVDCGPSLLVHWTQLRRLRPKLATLRALAIECYLAGVTPQNKKWNPRSVALLQQYCGTELDMKVEDNRNRGSVGVSLYDRSDEENVVCVNQEMIRHKYAVSFGIYSFNQNNIVESEAITNRAPAEQKPKPEKKKSITVLQNQTSPKKKINDKDLEAKDKGPVSLEAKLLHYQSPSLIYISLVQQQQVFNELFDKIQKHYATKKSSGKGDWKVGDRCCTICSASQTWRRGLVVEIDGSNAKIFYSDFACVETVPMANLHELVPEFASIGDAAIKCHLSGVVPAVGDEWPSLTKEFLKELLDVYKRIFITKVGNFNEKDKSLPIQIWVYHVIQGGALEPDRSEWRCLNKRIIEQGLGVPDKSQEVTVPENEAEAGDMLSFLNVKGSVTEWLQLEPLPQKPDANQCEVSNESSSPECEEIAPSCSNNPNTMFITDWQPAEPLQCTEFAAIPSYVDNDGIIYLHQQTQEDTLELIRKALDVRFKAPDPKAKSAKWSTGEPCIALYYLDNKFYRGKVLEVHNEACLVQYVDYGNEELCPYENMRKSIALYQLPIQAHKCRLNRIKPAQGRWNRIALDYIHKSVVEKLCFVRVTGETQGDVTPIDLKYDKLWINDHLVEFEMAKYTDGSKAKVPMFISKAQQMLAVVESDSEPDYIVDENDTPAHTTSTSYDSFNMNSMEGKDWNQILDEEEVVKASEQCISYPQYTNEEFLCNVSVINDMNHLELSIIMDDETAAAYSQLYDDVNENGVNMSPLNGIYENKACIALFPDDEKWYRATIVQYSEAKNQIKVRYVDFGNVAVISLAEAREPAARWLTLPSAALRARTRALSADPQLSSARRARALAAALLDRGPFHAKVLGYEDSLPLVELRNTDGELACADLIVDNILLPS
ncbi:tudor domain-containing protein 1 isoform X2 [Plodia interpunctella]|nr:tudor domain-containing protein 1 isoform X2 [Plodia interpunctella]